ncbi:MAG: hypothetical protein IT534_06925 [Bauldia sp.]|nr:hypothetical protein [Bauldia sp.]
MQLLRRLSLVDFALILALVVVGALAVLNQRERTGAGTAGGDYVLTNQNIAAFEAAVDGLITALATGRAADAAFGAVSTTVATAGDTALAPVVTALGNAHAMRNELGITSALRSLDGLLDTSPFAEYVLDAYAVGTLNYAFDAGPATPATGAEWVHLVWVTSVGDEPFLGWQIATGTATWTIEPGNSAVRLAFSVPGEGYSGTLLLAPASPGALMEASATLSVPLAESMVQLGAEGAAGEGILILDLGQAIAARPGQPWSGETRLGEPPGLVDDLRRSEEVVWRAVLTDGREFVMRIKMGETGRSAVATVFPAA